MGTDTLFKTHAYLAEQPNHPEGANALAQRLCPGTDHIRTHVQDTMPPIAIYSHIYFLSNSGAYILMKF